ncbi:hypothetical protein [Undibacterium oligocarboniphilum]|uniref:Uncharacterized protein n=1 Tax=Undibacterium oligocarboniphilum TaxID=666702 RepID=A0A850QIZ6_9BURK|nr:hypothetical protein [Undibacterium oligocarboniphilum]MBC3868759.1 hypothetical protein [Undibacterium oligocarboniphilum]NVO76740.1 hypothetical protein [Undibacterium oligocarboniphilum]
MNNTAVKVFAAGIILLCQINAIAGDGVFRIASFWPNALSQGKNGHSDPQKRAVVRDPHLSRPAGFAKKDEIDKQCHQGDAATMPGCSRLQEVKKNKLNPDERRAMRQQIQDMEREIQSGKK